MSIATDWLLERIAEDEESARVLEGYGTWTNHAGTRVVAADGTTMVETPKPPGIQWIHLPHCEHIARWDPARVLAECKAKRRIVEFYLDAVAWIEDIQDRNGYDESATSAAEAGVAEAHGAMQTIALPYAHRDDCPAELRASV